MEDLTAALGEAHVELRVWKKSAEGTWPFEDLKVIRTHVPSLAGQETVSALGDLWHRVAHVGLVAAQTSGFRRSARDPLDVEKRNHDSGQQQSTTIAGIEPEDVDVVVSTHIHHDHVGWNTRRESDSWVPTFANATYLVSEADYEYFRPENVDRMRAPETGDERVRFEGIRLVFADSIAPVAASGQLQTWQSEYRIGERLLLEPAPGHTPGSSVAWLGDAAVFVGDLVHTPVQLGRPHDACAFDLNPQQARNSRAAVLTAAARRGVTVFPARFAGRGGVRLALGDQNTPEIEGWAPLPSV